MNSPVFLAVDAGTGSARAIAFDESGRVVAHAAREWTHPSTPGHPGGLDFDTRANWRLVSEAIGEAVERLQGRSIASVSVSSMREGFVLYDERGEELWACPNVDGRSRAQADELTARGIAERIYEVGGDWVSVTAPARLLWLQHEEPDLFAEARHFGMLSDWLAYHLTGEFSTEPSCGSSSALFDLSARRWSSELLDAVGLAASVMPEVHPSGAIIGRVTADASLQTGLARGTPVVAGGADTQLALHGLGAEPLSPTVVAGSFWQATVTVDSPIVDPRRRTRTNCHVREGEWMVEGIGFFSGLAMRWLRDSLCRDLVTQARKTGTSAYELMEAEAASVPAGSHGMLAIIANVMRSAGWHHSAPAFVGFDVNDSERFGRGAFIRSLEEAAAYATRGHLEVLAELTHGASRRTGSIVLAGGSSTASLWPRIVAGVTGCETRLPNAPETTAYGAARLGAEALGASIPPARLLDRRIVADAADIAAYDRAYAQWLDVYAGLMEVTHRTGLTPLFEPPGGLQPCYRKTTAQ